MWWEKLTAVVKVELQKKKRKNTAACMFTKISRFFYMLIPILLDLHLWILYFDIRLLLFHEHAMNTQFLFSLIFFFFLFLQSKNMNFIMAVGQISFPFWISKLYIYFINVNFSSKSQQLKVHLNPIFVVHFNF